MPQFDWDKANRDHLGRHRVRAEEFEQAMSNEPIDLEWGDVEGEIRYHGWAQPIVAGCCTWSGLCAVRQFVQ